MPILLIFSGILFLLLLMLVLKINAFISLILVSLYIGFASGLSTDLVVSSIQKGFGDTLGSLTFIVVFGAMLGKLVGESGAAQKISDGLTSFIGKKNLIWAVVLTGFIVGIPLFYTAGFVLLIPLVFTIAAINNISPLHVGIPMAAALSVTHGFLPPHPGPVAIAALFKADIGKTLIFGFIIAIPSIILAGPLFANFVKNIKSTPASFKAKIYKQNELPGFGISIFCALLPVILITSEAVVSPFLKDNSFIYQTIKFLGNPVISMLIAVLAAVFLLGIFRGKSMAVVMNMLNEEISGIALILLIIGAGGAFKQILIDTKAGGYLALLFHNSTMSPLVLAWSAAAVIRLALGSATVAALTSAGIIMPIIGTVTASAELMVLAIGAGSLMFSHVNDAGFWIFKEYFNLSIGQTIRSWSIMETIVSVTGLLGVLVLDVFI